MKKLNKIFLTALFLITLLTCCLLMGCRRGENPDVTPAATTTAATTTAAPDPEPEPDPEPTDAFINAEFLKDYKIVTTFDADEELIAALIAGIKEKTGVELTSVVDTAGDEVTAKEILVGNTNREESSAREKALSYGIALKGEKLVISYGSDGMLEEAIAYLVNSFVDDAITVPLDYTYEKEYEMKIDGVGIGEYKIVYADDDEDGKTAAEFLASEILKATGVTVGAVTDAEAKGDYEIIMGTTQRGEAEACTEYYSYKVKVVDKSFVLSGYDSYALNNAAYGLLNALIDSKGDGKLADLNITYTLPAYTEYIEDIDKLYMRWIAEWQPDRRMLDYNTKLAEYINPTDRLLTCAHRAECYYYPENSIEAIISFYKMGGDVVELDIVATKDGKLVLMHDTTLSRMTDWSEKKGKNGLPTSNNVIDWTYEQLQQLNLREGAGGSNAAVTPFKIPTLAEALVVCKDRLLVIPDKPELWRYVDGDALKDHRNVFLYDAMVEADNYESILISYGLTERPDWAIAIQKLIYQKSGEVPYLMVRTNTGTKTVFTLLQKQAVPDTWGLQVNGRYKPGEFPTRYEEMYSLVKENNIMMWGWTIEDAANGYPDANDCADYWDAMYEVGYRMIMTNKYLELVKYAADTCNFD